MTLLTLLGASPVLAATLTVNPDGEADHDSLQVAVDSAADGDTIEVEGGEWGPVTVDGKELHITFGEREASLSQLTVVDATLSLTGATVRGEGAGIVSHNSDLSLEGMSFEGTSGDEIGPALRADGGSVVLRRASVRAWGAPSGSPMELNSTEADLEDVAFADTQGRRGGAISAKGGALSLSSVSISKASAAEAGGALYLDGVDFQTQDVAIQQTQGESGGAVFATNNSTLDLHDLRIAGATARIAGGALYMESCTTTAHDLSVSNSVAARGGALAIEQGSLEVQDMRAFGNEGREEGGAVWVDGGALLTLTRTEITGNLATRGGGLYIHSGAVTARNAIWTGNEAVEIGGAYLQADGALDLRFGVLASNVSEMGSAVAIGAGTANLEGLILMDQRGGDSVVSASDYSTGVSNSMFYESQNEQYGNVVIVDSLLTRDPEFVDGSWVPGPYSGALDAFNFIQDLDNTPADIGAYGGPDAWPLADADGDGYTAGRDCDDSDDQIHESAPDDFYDGVDADCRGDDDYDADGDGYSASNFGGLDCDDRDANANPAMAEVSGDATDSDCDGLYDVDADGDGWAEGVDCDDGDPSSHPWADDVPYDGVDSDCLGNDDYDADGDGYARGEDCDDQDPWVNPATPEVYDDGVDQDCDGYDATEGGGALAETDPALGHEYNRDFPLIPDAGPGLDEAGMGGCSSAPGRGGLLAGLLGMFGLMALRRRKN